MNRSVKKGICVGCILICTTLLSACSNLPITQQGAEKQAESLFQSHYNEFMEVIPVPSKGNGIPSIWDISNGKNLQITDALKEIGINEIFYSDGITYFQFEDEIWWTTPFGILYTEDVSSLDEWYRVENIEGNWYYYRIVS